MTAEHLKSAVRTLATDIGERNVGRPQALAAAADYIEHEMRSAGATVVRQTFTAAGHRVANIEALIPGRRPDAHEVLAGAHYDTVSGCPGANDNGSGVAALLELARRLAVRPLDRTLRLVAFVNEEPPFFQGPAMGSLVYAKALKDAGVKLRGMLSIETIGCYTDAPGSQSFPLPPLRRIYGDRGDFLAFVSNLASRAWLRGALASFRAGTDLPAQGAALPAVVSGVGWSDHWAFWQVGYDAVMVTDTAPYRYPHYHRASDTAEKLDYQSMAKAVDGLEAVLLTAAVREAKGSREEGPLARGRGLAMER